MYFDYFLFFFLAKDIFRSVKLRNSVYSAEWLNKTQWLSLCLFYSSSFQYDNGNFISLGSLLFLRGQFLIQFRVSKMSIENEYQNEYQNVEVPFGIVEAHSNHCEV